MAPCWFHISFWLNFKRRVTVPISLTSFLCLWLIFCFSWQQFFPSSVCCRLWVLCLWWSLPFCLLSFSEGHAEHRFALSWAMRGVHGSQSFAVRCHRRRSSLCWYLSAISSLENGKFLLKGRIQARLREVSRWFLLVCCQLLPRGPSYTRD